MQLETAERQGIVVIGEATTIASPDAVELLIAVRAAGQSITQALRDHAARSMALTQMMTSKGVGPAEIRLAAINVVPIYSSANQSTPNAPGVPPVLLPNAYGDVAPSGYHVESSVRITVHDVNRITEILDAIQLGPSHVTLGIWYRVGDEPAARRRTLDQAIRDARLKAQSMAAGIGKQLGEPISIVEEGAMPVNGNGSSQAPEKLQVFQPGELMTRVTVRVNYRLL